MSDTGTHLEFETSSSEATERLGRELGSALRFEGRATVIALEGELGAGKTCFVRGLAAGLGVDPAAVSSPSFVLAVEHPAGSAQELVHVDAWRLSDADELARLGWAEWLARPGCVIAIEWASRVAEALPAERIDVHLAHIGVDARRVSVDDRRGDPEALARLMRALRQPPRRCPRCEGPVAQDAASAPFCSKRCRDSDLARWFRGEYRLSRPLTSEDQQVDDDQD